MLDGVTFGGLIADKAFDTNAIITDLNQRGAEIVICQHPRPIGAFRIERDLYEWCHLIEKFFCNIRDSKRIAMRAYKI